MTEKSSTITNAVCKKLVEISASHEENADFEKALASVSILDKIKKIDTSAPLLDTKKDGLSIITLTGAMTTWLLCFFEACLTGMTEYVFGALFDRIPRSGAISRR